MTRFRMRVLAAAAAALAVADTGSAQVFRNFGGRGAAMGVNAPRYNTVTSPAYTGYAQPGITYAQPGITYAQPTTATYAVPTTAYSTMPTLGMGVVQTSGFVTGTPMTGMVQAGGYTNVPSMGVVTANGFVVPQQMGGMVVQTAAAMPQPTAPDRVTTQVLAPDGAAVTLSGTQADRTQGVRTFNSPQLDPAKTYTYRAKATWTENGKAMTREKSVDVRAGQQVTIDLTKPDANDKGGSDDSDRTDEPKTSGKQSD